MKKNKIFIKKINNKIHLSAYLMTTVYLKEGLFYATIGGVLGGVIGMFTAYSKTHASSNQLNGTSLKNEKYPHINLDPHILEILNYFKTYEKLIPKEYDTILENLNKLVELQVLINSGKIEARFPYRATTYVTNIQTALNNSKNKIRNTSVPHWETDEQNILQIADDYLFNITQDVNEHLMMSRN